MRLCCVLLLVSKNSSETLVSYHITAQYLNIKDRNLNMYCCEDLVSWIELAKECVLW